MDKGKEKCWIDYFYEILHLVQGDGGAAIPESVKEATGHGT